jgi:hypothetical protein
VYKHKVLFHGASANENWSYCCGSRAITAVVTAQEVCAAFRRFLVVIGGCDHVQSENGKEFSKMVWKMACVPVVVICDQLDTMLNEFGIPSVIHSSPYSPQTNGSIETANCFAKVPMS